VRDALASAHRYPDGACFDLRAALAKRFAIGEQQLVFGCGADEILELVAKSFLGAVRRGGVRVAGRSRCTRSS
jgi:histidinol-phosphate aminotransferase